MATRVVCFSFIYKEFLQILEHFHLVQNTPVFSFYFQSLQNSSCVCVPAAPSPTFLICAQSVFEKLPKPLGLVSKWGSSLEKNRGQLGGIQATAQLGG